MAHPNRLANARVLVFGGTSGIGFAVASLAASQGAYVTISGSKQPKVDDKVSLLRSYYPSNPPEKIAGLALDLLDTTNLESNLAAFFDKLTENGAKKFNHIVFTAGDFIFMPKIHEVTVENVMPTFTVRFLVPLLIGKLIATGKYVDKSLASSFTITGGTNTKRPAKGWVVAASVGGSSEGLMRGLAVDLAPVRVNLVEAGAIDTELLQNFTRQTPPDVLEQMKLTNGLLGTFGLASDVAEAYGWFMRDQNATGAVAASDNGRLLTGIPLTGNMATEEEKRKEREERTGRA